MAAKQKKAKRLGRPPKEFTTKQIEEIDGHSFNQARDYTIAETLGIEIMTFRKHFSKRCAQNRARGKLEMHRRQRELMFEEGKAACGMAIWLGKQHLEQSDKADISGGATQKVVVNIVADGKVIKADIVDDTANVPSVRQDISDVPEQT